MPLPDNPLRDLLDEQPDDPEERTVGDHAYTDLGNARLLVEQHGHDLRFAPQFGSWLHWDGHRWAEDMTGETQRRAKAVVDAMVTKIATVASQDARKKLFQHWMRSQSAGRLEAMVAVARTEPNMAVLVRELDADPLALNTKSGVINLATGALTPHDRHSLVTKLAPIALDSSATCPIWERFVDWAMGGDNELTAFVQRAVGYSLSGAVSEQCLFFLHGTGENGKSTFLTLLGRLLDDYAIAAEADLLLATTHERHSTGIADLVGRRLVVVQETDEGRRLAEATVKQLTGGDTIRARRMRQDNFEFRPTHKIWMAANHKPVVRGTDHAIWRRIRLIPFVAQLQPGERDDHLLDKLTAELPGILNWALEGARQWCKDGLRPPVAVINATTEYRHEQDHVGRFIDDACTLADDVMVPAKELRTAYEQWCEENGERPWSAKAMGPQLVERDCERLQEGRSKTWTWVGITVADNQHTITPSLMMSRMGRASVDDDDSAAHAAHSQRAALANDLPGPMKSAAHRGPYSSSPLARARRDGHTENGPHGPRQAADEPDSMF